MVALGFQPGRRRRWQQCSVTVGGRTYKSMVTRESPREAAARWQREIKQAEQEAAASLLRETNAYGDDAGPLWVEAWQQAAQRQREQHEQHGMLLAEEHGGEEGGGSSSGSRSGSRSGSSSSSSSSSSAAAAAAAATTHVFC